jgi:hypothetical protein
MYVLVCVFSFLKYFSCVQPKVQDELIIAREIVINDAESSVRYKLTKRQTQEEVSLSKLVCLGENIISLCHQELIRVFPYLSDSEIHWCCGDN